MDLTVVPLHKNKQYIPECCKLINDEWKRSETARLHSLESSSDNLPTSLILLKNNKIVIGHVRLSIIPSISDACFLESVVIDKSLRGQGYGTILMNKSEDYCRDQLHLKTIYLKTKGQEQFYNKLAYNKCQPISIYGSYTPKIINNPYTNNNNKLNNNTVLQGTAPKPPPLPSINVNCNTHTFMKKDL